MIKSITLNLSSKEEGDKTDKRSWCLEQKDETGTIVKEVQLNLKQSSVTNKYYSIQDAFNRLSDIEGGAEWFANTLNLYIEKDDSTVIINNAKNFLLYSEKIIDNSNIDFTTFSANMQKATKSTILFMYEDIRNIAICSMALKLYGVFSNTDNLQLPQNSHKVVYHSLITPCLDTQVVMKIFEIVRSRIYRSNTSDRYMWELIKIMIQKTPESYIMTIFIFIMDMFITFDITQNPVPFIISLIDDSIRFLMRDVYKDRIIYGESNISVEGTNKSISKQIFYVHCCNDVILKSAKAGLELIEKLNPDDLIYNRIRDNIDQVISINPIMYNITLPLASKILDIPYSMFHENISPKHTVLIGILLRELLKDDLEYKYKTIVDLLYTIPSDNESVSIKSSYRLKNIESIINDNRHIFGFGSKYIKYDLISNLCGIIIAASKKLKNIDGEKYNNVTIINKLEKDLSTFFLDFHSGTLNNIIENSKNKLDEYF